jgi:glycosidase
MVGGPTPADEDKRTPMRWDATGPNFGFTTGTPWRRAPEAAGVDVATQSADPNSLLSHYRQLIRLRLAHPALRTGGATRPMTSGGGPGTTAVLRSKDNQRVLYVVNFKNEAATDLAIELEGTPNALLAQGIEAPRREGTRLVFPTLAPRSYAYYTLE